MVGGSTGGGGGYSGGGGGGYYGGYGDEMSDEERELAQAQKELLEEQTGILREQHALMQAFLPSQIKEMGYEPTYGTDGKLNGYKPGPDAIKRGQLNSEMLDRSLMALRGELPIGSALTKALDEQELAMKDRLTKQFGPGYETSSPGIETMQKFNEGAAALKEDASRGLLTQSEQLSQARTGANIGSQGALSNMALAAPMNVAQMFGNVATGYGAAQQPYTQSRIATMNANTQMDIASMNNQAAMQASQQNSMMSMLPYLMGGFSDERMKDDIKPTGVTLGEALGTKGGGSNIEISEWRYKTDPKGTRRYGPMAQDVEKHYPGAVSEDSKGRKYIDGNSLTMNLLKEKHAASGGSSSGMTLREALGAGA